MTEADDIELLRQYAEENSEAAFAALAGRHVNLVYSVALRHTGNPHAAEEITQAVFIILARKANSFSRQTILTGWLHQTTRLTAANFLRTEIRRQHREQEAFMQSTLSETETWMQIAPLLDDAISKLGERERNAILLRYFENKSAREMAAALRVDEPAAQKRVTRAVEKLRAFFAKRGITLTAAAIAGAVSANSVQAAPIGLAVTVTATAAKGAAVSASTLTLIKGALKAMAWTKVKTAIVAGAAALVAVSTATVAIKAAFFPAIKDVYFQPNYRHFQNLPRGLFVLRPTHFITPANGLDYSAEDSSPSGEHVTLFMGRNQSFEQLIAKGYGGRQPYTVFPANVPRGNFDYLCTILDSRAGEHLQMAIKKKLGYAASWQQRDTEVFLLKVQTPNSPGLKPGNPSGNSVTWRNSQNRLEVRNRSLASLAYEMENSANVPVMDKTGLGNSFDFDLDCAQGDLANRNWDNVNQALGQLGLELVSTNMPMNMLVVEKVNH